MRCFASLLAAAAVLAATSPLQANPQVITSSGQIISAAPAPVRPVRSGGNMGGGFVEYLFSGGQAPVYAPPAPAQPQYYGGSVYAPPGGPSVRELRLPPNDPRMQRAPEYRARVAGGYASAPMRAAVSPVYQRQTVDYTGPQKPGTVVIDTDQRFLYLVQSGGKAIRYGIGVGRPGFEWRGVHRVSSKREWPDWRPPTEMLQRRPELPRYMAGGPQNPLGARAMYLGSTLYRIHGSNEPWTIGQAVSSGCIRMTNDDVIDLYGRVPVGTKVVVL